MKHPHLDKENFKKNPREPSSRLTTHGILCACPVHLLSPLFAVKSPNIHTPDLRRNGKEWDKGITILSTKNNRP
jgi:hypothetical protein